MKKWLIGFLVSVITFVNTLAVSPAITFAAASEQVQQQSGIQTSSSGQVDPELTKVLNEIIVLPKGDYNKEEADKMIERISHFGVKILKKFKAKGEKIKLCNGPITNEPELAYLKGQTPRGWEGTGKTWDIVPGAGGFPVVVRIGYSEPSRERHNHTSINLELHETSHAIDKYVFKDISETPAFRKIWKQECPNVFGAIPYFNNYVIEYFAETFAMYNLNDESRKKLQEKAPLTCQFYQKMVSDLKE